MMRTSYFLMRCRDGDVCFALLEQHDRLDFLVVLADKPQSIGKYVIPLTHNLDPEATSLYSQHLDDLCLVEKQ